MKEVWEKLKVKTIKKKRYRLFQLQVFTFLTLSFSQTSQFFSNFSVFLKLLSFSQTSQFFSKFSHFEINFYSFSWNLVYMKMREVREKLREVWEKKWSKLLQVFNFPNAQFFKKLLSFWNKILSYWLHPSPLSFY